MGGCIWGDGMPQGKSVYSNLVFDNEALIIIVISQMMSKSDVQYQDVTPVSPAADIWSHSLGLPLPVWPMWPDLSFQTSVCLVLKSCEVAARCVSSPVLSLQGGQPCSPQRRPPSLSARRLLLQMALTAASWEPPRRRAPPAAQTHRPADFTPRRH